MIGKWLGAPLSTPGHQIRLSGGTDAEADFGSGLQGTRLVTRVLIIVQNLPVPFDRRVWLECQALISDGYQVAVVCPKGNGDPAHEVINTVELYKYRPYAPGGSKLSFVTEYAYSFLATAWLTLKARRSGRFGVIQACNPPDIFWPIAMALRALDGTRFVFDHHDLCPELYESRFPDGPRLPYRALRALERRTHRTADHVISTNESYRDVAVTRSGKPATDVTVVRTGPDPEQLGVASPTPSCVAAAGSSPPTSASWGRRTGSTSLCAPPTSWSMSSAAMTSPSR